MNDDVALRVMLAGVWLKSTALPPALRHELALREIERALDLLEPAEAAAA